MYCTRQRHKYEIPNISHGHQCFREWYLAFRRKIQFTIDIENLSLNEKCICDQKLILDQRNEFSYKSKKGKQHSELRTDTQNLVFREITGFIYYLKPKFPCDKTGNSYLLLSIAIVIYVNICKITIHTFVIQKKEHSTAS